MERKLLNKKQIPLGDVNNKTIEILQILECLDEYHKIFNVFYIAFTENQFTCYVLSSNIGGIYSHPIVIAEGDVIDYITGKHSENKSIYESLIKNTNVFNMEEIKKIKNEYDNDVRIFNEKWKKNI